MNDLPAAQPLFDRVLIANRGEIACRIIRTCHALGIHAIAVYAAADAHAMHVKMADEAWPIGPSEPAKSYLDMHKILQVAKASGAQAIHPGYGFLSENTDFSRACTAAGMTFIGPHPDSIERMGSKAEAKAVMDAHGVPVVPGYHGDRQDADFLSEQATAIGFPLMIKAAWGGGGKGMRIVREHAAFDAELAAAKREAKGAFGDDTVILERYIDHPRHIEFQVFADNHGHVIHLNERECSAQRRFQKVLEETPSPFLTPALRTTMGQAAVAAARAVDYRGAGTVEFIVDPSGTFFFMEMNTRLQVEHPVTEMTLGLDLVEWQLRVANNEPLPLSQEAIQAHGHAIEVRIYAEDPARQFLPSSGHIDKLTLPAPSAHVRIDGGVESGDDISVFYDPMIAKLIVWGNDRHRALQRMEQALAACFLAGPQSNIHFLEQLVRHPAIREASIDTGFLDRHLQAFMPNDTALDPVLPALASVAFLLQARQTDDSVTSPWDVHDNWRIDGTRTQCLTLMHGKQRIRAEVQASGEAWQVQLDATTLHIDRAWLAADCLWAQVHGNLRRYPLHRFGQIITLHTQAGRHRFTRVANYDWDDHADENANRILAPMPGHIVLLQCAIGDTVAAGDPLITMEAMKMELTLRAPMDGCIKNLTIAAGEFVDADTVLLEIDEST